MAKLKPHPYADLFPMMTAAELDALAADVAEHGLRQAVVLYGGAVLDGRNRLLACEKAGIEPTFTEFTGDDAGALAMVISLNVQRRDLTQAQRAIVAARALPHFEEERATNRGGDTKRHSGKTSPNGRARDDVGKVFKVSDKSVQQAKALLTDAPDLATQVEGGAMPLATAYEQHVERKKQAAVRTKQAERVNEYKDAVDSGEMTLEEALRKIQEQADGEKREIQAQAEARNIWLKGLGGMLDWLALYVAKRTDEDLPWFFLPEAPGSFKHGITSERIEEGIAQLNRIQTFALEIENADDASSKSNGQNQKSRSQMRSRAV